VTADPGEACPEEMMLVQRRGRGGEACPRATEELFWDIQVVQCGAAVTLDERKQINIRCCSAWVLSVECGD
ncbi:hypothetical protein NDU88_000029, partial [Pleurodeles waltl]